jgi:AraC-like DNA-binding protein
VSEAAAIVAKRLLFDSRHSIQETAFAMGFSDASAFHHAFKRWTGTTPTRFRSGT